MSQQNDSTTGELFRKALQSSDSERLALLSDLPATTRANLEQLLALDADAQEKGLLNSFQPVASEHGRFVPGTQITQRYRIVSLAGRGGMGEVYRADDLQIGESVALKFPTWNLQVDQQQAQRFYAEVRSARQVTHPSVCQVYDIGEFEGDTFITMEFIDGEDLKSLIRRVGRLSHEKATEIGRQICAGLAAAHSQGVLHRDLKPANVMIDGKGHARITDFGMATVAQKNTDESGTSGTPAYMAPEQLLHGKTSVQSDLYSLGLILFELFTGQYPHASKSTKELIKLHQNDSGPVRPSDLIDETDPAIDVVVRRCLEANPSERPKNSASVAAQLSFGNPIDSSLSSNELPSTDLLATYGQLGTLTSRVASLLLVLTCVGWAMLMWLSSSSRQLNLTTLVEPAVLQRDAQWTIEQFGYSIDPVDGIDWASGFLAKKNSDGTNATPEFWYRQSPVPLIGIQIPLEAKPANYGTMVDLNDPPWITPGMIGLTVDPVGGRDASHATLKWLRATPVNRRVEMTTSPAEVDWKKWFSVDVVGFDLDQLKPASWRNRPPDAFDHQAAWEGTVPDANDDSVQQQIYVEAASFRGRPTYFRVMTQEEFDLETPALTERSLSETDTGFGLPISNILTVLAIVFFARRNWRLRRCDRAGAVKIATFVLVGQLIGWLCLTSHVFGSNEYFLVRDGIKSALGSAFTAWVVYLALEPFVRRHVPNLLVSWARLLDGRWTDPIVGRDVLFALTTAVWVEVVLALVHSLPNANRLAVSHQALGGWDGVVGVAIGGGTNYVTWMLIIFTTCVAVYRFSGQRWLACAFIFLGIGLSAAARDGNFGLCYLYVAVAVLPALGTVRCGLLFLVAFAVFDSWLQQPITTQTGAFYFATTVLMVVVFMLIALLSAFISLGNRRKTLLA